MFYSLSEIMWKLYRNTRPVSQDHLPAGEEVGWGARGFVINFATGIENKKKSSNILAQNHREDIILGGVQVLHQQVFPNVGPPCVSKISTVLAPPPLIC